MTRDPLDLLAAARPAELDPAIPTGPATRAGELSAALAVRPERRARGRRLAWAGGGLGLIAAGAAAAIVIPGTGTGVPRGPASTATSRLDARTVLLAAADTSLRRPSTGGAYWYVQAEAGQIYQVTGASYRVVDRQGHRQWVARAAGVNSYFADQHLGAGPFTAADTARWRRAGSPASWPVQGLKPGLVLTPAPGKPYGGQTNIGDKVFAIGDRNVTMTEVLGLPTTPDGLQARLLRDYHGHSTESDMPQDRGDWLFTVTVGLLRDLPVKPATRAAAFRLLAALPGNTALGTVDDAKGRPGQGIARVDVTNPNTGTLQRRIVIDPATGLLLSDEEYALMPSGAYAGLAPGSMVHYDVTLTASWTDARPVKAGPPA